jgi:16S rRNA U1498 N3-methylase RsmE
MQQYFVSQLEMKESTITGDDVFHIKSVMRSRIGDKIIVSDESVMYLASISEINKDNVKFIKEEVIQSDTELPFFVTFIKDILKVTSLMIFVNTQQSLV